MNVWCIVSVRYTARRCVSTGVSTRPRVEGSKARDSIIRHGMNPSMGLGFFVPEKDGPITKLQGCTCACLKTTSRTLQTLTLGLVRPQCQYTASRCINPTYCLYTAPRCKHFHLIAVAINSHHPTNCPTTTSVKASICPSSSLRAAIY
jgi:hypothetical protein